MGFVIGRRERSSVETIDVKLGNAGVFGGGTTQLRFSYNPSTGRGVNGSLGAIGDTGLPTGSRLNTDELGRWRLTGTWEPQGTGITFMVTKAIPLTSTAPGSSDGPSDIPASEPGSWRDVLRFAPGDQTPAEPEGTFAEPNSAVEDTLIKLNDVPIEDLDISGRQIPLAAAPAGGFVFDTNPKVPALVLVLAAVVIVGAIP